MAFVPQLRDTDSALTQLQSTQTKTQSENAELSQQLADAESKASTLSKAKQQLESQLDDVKGDLETETNVRCHLFFYPFYVLPLLPSSTAW